MKTSFWIPEEYPTFEEAIRYKSIIKHSKEEHYGPYSFLTRWFQFIRENNKIVPKTVYIRVDDRFAKAEGCITCRNPCYGVHPPYSIHSYCCICLDDEKTDFDKSLYCELCQKRPTN